MLDSQSSVSIGRWLAMAALTTATAVAVYFAWRPADARSEKERRRRLKVNATGRFADGTVVDCRTVASAEGGEREELVLYQYSVGGVEYSARRRGAAGSDQRPAVPHRRCGQRQVRVAALLQLDHHLRGADSETTGSTVGALVGETGRASVL